MLVSVSELRSIVQRKQARRARLQASLDAIVRQLVDLGALRIILFGSFVDGEVDVHSDLDFLVIMPSSKSGKEWSKAVYDAVERGAAAGIIAYNQVEFEEALPTSSFLERVVNSGRVVYEKAVQG